MQFWWRSYSEEGCSGVFFSKQRDPHPSYIRLELSTPIWLYPRHLTLRSDGSANISDMCKSQSQETVPLCLFLKDMRFLHYLTDYQTSFPVIPNFNHPSMGKGVYTYHTADLSRR